MLRYMTILIVPALIVGFVLGFAPGSRQVAAHGNQHSHLKITSTVPYTPTSATTNEVINNAIQVEIKAERQCAGGGDEIDSGILTLTPSDPPSFGWTWSNCPNGFFQAVMACATLDGCDSNDVVSWLVGVHVQAGGNCGMGPDVPNEVVYTIDSDDLGDGKRWVRRQS